MGNSIRAKHKPCFTCKVRPRAYTSYCRECHNDRANAWVRNNAEKVRERQRKAYRDKLNHTKVKEDVSAKLMLLHDIANNTPEDYDLCITWPGFKIRKGYGQVWLDGKAQYVHRVMLEYKLGRPIRKGYETLHSCDNPSCVNPNHLSEGTHKQNMQEASERGLLGKNGKRRKYSPEERARIKQLYNEGWSVWRISYLVGVPYPTCLFIAKAEERKDAA